MKKITYIVLLLLGFTPIALFSQMTFVNKPYVLQLMTNGINGHIPLDKFGINPLITTVTDPEDVWEFGGVYTFDEDGTAPIKYVSASSVADTQYIVVSGLNYYGELTTQRVKLNGQTNVSLTDSLWRVNRMYNDDSFSFAGNVYCHTDPSPTSGVPASVAVRAYIYDGNNQTLMAIYTIPKDYVGYLFRGEVGIGTEGSVNALNEFAHVHYESRRFGKVFRVKKSIDLIVGGNPYFQDYRSFPDIIPELTDIRIRVIEVTDNMGIWATFDIMLIHKSQLNHNYLESIGMSAE